MSLKVSENNQRKRDNGLIIEPDFGWLGPKPANTKAEKIHQIKTEFIDERALLIEGAKASDFPEYPHVSATISVQDLIRYVDTLNETNSFLVIEDLDKVPTSEQEKFVPLVKDRQILSSKLPSKIQILIPIKDTEPVLREIQSLTFPLKVA